MKKAKKLIVALLVCVMAFATFAFAGCGEKEISVITRNEGSGTRDAFESIVKSDAGVKLGDAELKDGVLQYDSTSTVITQVSGVETAIGYVSLGSVDDTIKVLKVNGVEATAANVLNGTYKLQRPFVIMTNKSVELQDATADFIRFLKSTQAQEIVAGDYVKQEEGAVQYTSPSTALSGTVVIRGSTSVDPLMDVLIGKYKEINGNKVANVEFQKDCQGSSAGIEAVKKDTAGNVIGLSSSAIKDADAPSMNYFHIALDAIAVIVNKNNELSDITISQLFDIYTGAITKFSELSSK